MEPSKRRPGPAARPGGKTTVQVADPFQDMMVEALSVDPITGLPVVILRGDDRATLAISIGLGEASAIASELEQVRLERPMTHDLMRDLLVQAGLGVDRIEIAAYREGVYYATVWVDRGEQGRVPVDARPSDAIALALRAGAPVRVARSLASRPRAAGGAKRKGGDKTRGIGPDASDEDLHEAVPERFLELLESLSDEDFGKWKM